MEEKPTYEELEARLAWAEGVIAALREGEVDAVVSQSQVALLRLAEAERTLRESEDLHRGAIEALGGVVYNMAGGGDTYTFMSRGVREMTGYGLEELTPELFKSLALERRTLYPSEDVPTSMRDGGDGGETEMRQAEILIRSRDGRERWILDTAANTYTGSDEAATWIGILFDVTEQKKAEEALRESERIYREAIEAAGAVPFLSSKRDLVYEFIGNGIEELVGYAPEMFTPSLWSSIILERVPTRHLAGLTPDEARERAAQEGLPWSADIRVRARNGEERWLEDTSVCVRDTWGEVTGSLGMLRNITERKMAEGALRESEEKYRTLVDHHLDGIYIHRDGQFLFANDKLLDILGYAWDELERTDSIKTLTPESFELIAERGRKRKRGEPIPDEYEFQAVRKDGTVIDVQAHVKGIEYEGQLATQGSLRDITEHKKLERELVRLERLRALGEMSAGVSHNLNNILTSALGPAQLIRRMTDDPAVQREAGDIIKATMRARDLVHRLHLTTRGVEEESVQPVHVNKVVEEAGQVSRPRWKDEPESKGVSIEVVTQLEYGPSVAGSESGLHDIIVNLILNAVDAMPEGGTISIRTVGSGQGALISVKDTGVGMDEETRRRVFEPFFTTKVDVGSGLGLSTAYNAVFRWGGQMSVASTPGEGTIFSIWFPAWTASEDKTEDAEPAGTVPVRSAKLLIVEDDKGVCDFLSRLLGGHHDVEVVGDGPGAIERFAPERYDVALIDIGIPGMAGDRVAREIRRADPSLATVLITGWELAEDDPRASPFDFRIQKPFDDLGEVEEVVAEAVALHDERAKSPATSYE